jgi:hypothetical protein
MALAPLTPEYRMRSPSGLSPREENAYVIELLREIKASLELIGFFSLLLTVLALAAIFHWWAR